RVGGLSLRGFDAVPWSELATFSGAMEGGLRVAHPALGWLLVLAVLVSLIDEKLRGVALSCAVLLLAAWSVGRPLTAWPLFSVVPGMSGINYPLRAQWALLVFGPVLLGAVAHGLLDWVVTPSRSALVTSVGAGLVALLLLPATAVEDRAPQGRPIAAVGSQQVRGHTSDAALMSDAARDGLLRAGQATALGYPDLPLPVPSSPRVVVKGNTVTLDGRPGDVLLAPQRALDGWSCRGGEVVTHSPASWLHVRLTQERASCRWTTPWLKAGVASQVLALLALLMLAVWRRPQPGAQASAPGSKHPPSSKASPSSSAYQR
ncbi:MAG: hypothetical protein KDA24_26905, partial [Deltaproteobacteria bacterium]|nr:hypothetical protein [Deltaproteobacteria bacterium]